MYDEIMTLAQPSIGNQRLNRKNMKRDGWLWARLWECAIGNDDEIPTKGPKLRLINGRNLPVKEFCYLRTNDTTAAM